MLHMLHTVAKMVITNYKIYIKFWAYLFLILDFKIVLFPPV